MKNKLFFYSVILCLISLFLIFFAFHLRNSLVLDKKEIPVKLEVGEISGFDLSNGTMSFGTVSPGTASGRFFTVENGHSFPIVISIDSKGNISRFLLFEKNFEVLPGSPKNISIGTISPSNKDYGNYSGEIIVIFKKSMK